MTFIVKHMESGITLLVRQEGDILQTETGQLVELYYEKLYMITVAPSTKVTVERQDYE